MRAMRLTEDGLIPGAVKGEGRCEGGVARDDHQRTAMRSATAVSEGSTRVTDYFATPVKERWPREGRSGAVLLCQ